MPLELCGSVVGYLRDTAIPSMMTMTCSHLPKNHLELPIFLSQPAFAPFLGLRGRVDVFLRRFEQYCQRLTSGRSPSVFLVCSGVGRTGCSPSGFEVSHQRKQYAHILTSSLPPL